MSLDHALRIVRDEATVFGSADKYLLAQLNAAGDVPPGKRLALPVGLQGDFPVRPVEVLLALLSSTQRATRTCSARSRWGAWAAMNGCSRSTTSIPRIIKCPIFASC